ncbi:oligopeptide/dipeptide ABC transporter ATP-binding protein [Ilumatobacter sp.]|uniref:oligopeptide/dipeptide ABC transporter ATP-binding protein n=1 Tax=Ilumatobacter sp. TaxID=1967498 RepID=UPI003B5275DB
MAGSGTAHLRDEPGIVLGVDHLVVEFPTKRGRVHAVTDVSFDLANRETLGIVGESGCGKSSTGKAIMRVPPPTSGTVQLDGVDLSSLSAEELRDVRGRMQMIFQDAVSSLNPRLKIRDVVADPLKVRWLESFDRSPVIEAWERYVPWMLKLWRHPFVRKAMLPILVAFFAGLILWVGSTAFGSVDADGMRDGGIVQTIGTIVMIAALVAAAPIVAMFVVTGAVWAVLTLAMPFASIPRALRIRRARPQFEAETAERVRQVLDDVGIDPEAAMDRRPHEFSGGQAQRISIARALILDPKVIICDEPVSALDVSVQAQVLNLLEDIKAKYGVSLIFIAHDLAVVKNVSDRVVVMYLGKICEVASPDRLFGSPRHPYTNRLLSAIPATDPSIDPRASATLGGELPSPIDPPSGCRFRTRCPNVGDVCATEEPQIRPLASGHYVACHFPVEDGSVPVGGAHGTADGALAT